MTPASALFLISSPGKVYWFNLLKISQVCSTSVSLSPSYHHFFSSLVWQHIFTPPLFFWTQSNLLCDQIKMCDSIHKAFLSGFSLFLQWRQHTSMCKYSVCFGTHLTSKLLYIIFSLNSSHSGFLSAPHIRHVFLVYNFTCAVPSVRHIFLFVSSVHRIRLFCMNAFSLKYLLYR